MNTSIITEINDIRKKIPYDFESYSRPPLYEYKIGRDKLRRVICLSADVRPDSLDKGSDITDLAIQCARFNGLRGDFAKQYIEKKLGGCGSPDNVFPFNTWAGSSTKALKADEDLVYLHIKQGTNRHAHLVYGIKYNEEHAYKIDRPHMIFYHFELYENNVVVGQAIEGVFENK